MLKKMLKIKNSVVQNGLGNLAIFKSPNVTVNQVQALDQLRSYTSSGEINQAADLIRQMKDFVDSQHPAAPYYKYEFGVNSEGEQYVSHVPAFPGAEKLRPLKGNVRLVIPEEYKHFKNMRELINYSYGMQQPLEMDVKSLKTWVGEDILEEFTEEENKKLRIKMIPNKFPPPSPMKIYLKDNSWSLDYIEIGVKQINGSKILMDNSQNVSCPFSISFEIDVERLSANFNILIRDESMNSVKQVLKFKELVEAGKPKKKPKLALKLLKDDTDVLVADNWKFNEKKNENTEEFIVYLRKLSQIEEDLNINFCLPERPLENWEVLNTELIYLSMKGEFHRQPFTTKFELYLDSDKDIERLFSVASVNSNCFNVNLELSRNENLEMFGADLMIKRQHVYLEGIQLDNLSKVRKKNELREKDESLRVIILPSRADSYISTKLEVVSN
ncbi:hypothetical protein [Bacillus sp. NRRL B-14911]|uniref:hypothetical protein n=1 Tax=Bacillus sp. NRRL B-14911 TaxID=313627 RepID=UPI00054EAA13|nr:hypothetical protein [Bacillus sp. NRRL B-14911]